MPKAATLILNEENAITLEEVKAQLRRYIDMTQHTGEQLGWDYAAAAFPYTIEDDPEKRGQWFVLKGKNPNYRTIIIGMGKNEQNQPVIQIILPNGATHGDIAKGNEFTRYLGKALKAETRLFNGRTMYFNR